MSSAPDPLAPSLPAISGENRPRRIVPNSGPPPRGGDRVPPHQSSLPRVTLRHVWPELRGALTIDD